MTTNNTVLNLPYYSYIDTDGSPLFNGFVYVGIANTDPLITANRIDVSAIQAGGNTVVINQPIRTNSAGLLIDNVGNVIFPVVSDIFSIKVTDSLGSLVYEESAVNNFGNSVVSTIKKYLITVTNGQTVIDLNVLFSIKPSAVSLYINGRYQQESSGAYIYSSTTGSILLDSPLVTSDEVEVIVNDIVGTSIAFTQPTSEVVSLKDYVTNTIDAGSGLLAACIAGRIVDFAGMTLEVIDDFIMPLNSICVEWRLNGATVNFKTGVCYLGNSSAFMIDLQGGKIKLGAKKALVTVNSVANGNSFTVDSTADFVVGDELTCSFSNGYLPNSTSRIGGANPLQDFNRITALTATTITVTSNVPEVIPANAWLLSARFDLKGIEYTGTGTFTIKNGSIKESRSGYFISVIDVTQKARFISENVEYDGSSLDQFNLQCHSAFFSGGSIGRAYDIAKQCIVANHSVDGVISLSGVYSKRFNRDAFFYLNSLVASVGDIYMENCHIDGINDRVFSGSAMDYESQNSLHLISYSGDGFGLTPDIGHVRIKGGSIKNINRSIFGTTFSTKTTLSFKSYKLSNVIPCEADPLFISVTDEVNSNFGYCSFDDCEITSALTTLNEGYPIEDTGKIVYNRGSIKPNGATIGSTSFTIARSTLNNCEIKRGDAGEFYKLLGDSSQLTNVRLRKKPLITNGQLSFLEGYTQSSESSLILLDHVIRTSGFIDPLNWFNGVDNVMPNIEFSFPGVGTNFFYGNPDTSTAQAYKIELQAKRWNDIPYLTRGYTTLYTPANSTIKGADGTLGKVTLLFNTTLSANAAVGALTITVTNNTSITTGTILGFLDVNTPSDFVYWHKVQSITGSIATLTSALTIALVSGNVVRGYTPTKLY